MKNVMLGIAIGVMLTVVFVSVVSILDSTRSYKVYSVDDHTVTLKSETGNFISVDVENTPAVSFLEIGSVWIINYR